MIYLYIFGPIVLMITFVVVLVVRHSKNKRKRFLERISWWKVDDMIEISDKTSDYYYCVETNNSHSSSKYREKANQAYKDIHGVEKPYAKLKKWDDKHCLIEMADGETYHMDVKFIKINITATTRKIDKGMDNFVTEKQKMRFKKLGRLLDNTKENQDGQ